MLDEVFDNLRAVTFTDDGTTIRLHFFTLAEPSEEDVESTSVIGTEVIADFDEPTMIDETIEVVPFDQPLPQNAGTWIFSRKAPL